MTLLYLIHTINYGIFAETPVCWPEFADPATGIMEGIIDLHHEIFFYLISITFFVLAFIVQILFYFNLKTRDKWFPISLRHDSLLEMLWTIAPTIILLIVGIPTFFLLYMSDELGDTCLTIKAVAHQWFWHYEYSDIVFNHDISFESHMLDLRHFFKDQFDIMLQLHKRLLDVDNRLLLPSKTPVQLLVTSEDVLHSFAIPSFGVKVDAIPGRLNQTGIETVDECVAYGQCSEICGVNHAFMPITAEAVDMIDFLARMAFIDTTKNFSLQDIDIQVESDPNGGCGIISIVDKGSDETTSKSVGDKIPIEEEVFSIVYKGSDETASKSVGDKILIEEEVSSVVDKGSDETAFSQKVKIDPLSLVEEEFFTEEEIFAIIDYWILQTKESEDNSVSEVVPNSGYNVTENSLATEGKTVEVSLNIPFKAKSDEGIFNSSKDLSDNNIKIENFLESSGKSTSDDEVSLNVYSLSNDGRGVTLNDGSVIYEFLSGVRWAIDAEFDDFYVNFSFPLFLKKYQSLANINPQNFAYDITATFKSDGTILLGSLEGDDIVKHLNGVSVKFDSINKICAFSLDFQIVKEIKKITEIRLEASGWLTIWVDSPEVAFIINPAGEKWTIGDYIANLESGEIIFNQDIGDPELNNSGILDNTIFDSVSDSVSESNLNKKLDSKLEKNEIELKKKQAYTTLLMLKDSIFTDGIDEENYFKTNNHIEYLIRYMLGYTEKKDTIQVNSILFNTESDVDNYFINKVGVPNKFFSFADWLEKKLEIKAEVQKRVFEQYLENLNFGVYCIPTKMYAVYELSKPENFRKCTPSNMDQYSIDALMNGFSIKHFHQACEMVYLMMIEEHYLSDIPKFGKIWDYFSQDPILTEDPRLDVSKEILGYMSLWENYGFLRRMVLRGGIYPENRETLMDEFSDDTPFNTKRGHALILALRDPNFVEFMHHIFKFYDVDIRSEGLLRMSKEELLIYFEIVFHILYNPDCWLVEGAEQIEYNRLWYIVYKNFMEGSLIMRESFVKESLPQLETISEQEEFILNHVKEIFLPTNKKKWL